MEINTPNKIHIAICEKILPRFCVYRSNSLLTTPNAKPASSMLKGLHNIFFKIPALKKFPLIFQLRLLRIFRLMQRAVKLPRLEPVRPKTIGDIFVSL